MLRNVRRRGFLLAWPRLLSRASSLLAPEARSSKDRASGLQAKWDKEVDEANTELMQHFLVEGDPAQDPAQRGRNRSSSPATELLQYTLQELPEWERPLDSEAGNAGTAASGSTGLPPACPAAEGSRLTHVDSQGRANMVDVSQKLATVRTAVASALVRFASSSRTMEGLYATVSSRTLWRALDSGQADLRQRQQFLRAQLAGIRAAKLTSLFIPLCHNINLAKVDVQLHPGRDAAELRVVATATAVGQTGVEMEALTAATFAAISVLGAERQQDSNASSSGSGSDGRIELVQLESKSGGKSGDYSRSSGSAGSSSSSSDGQASGSDGSSGSSSPDVLSSQRQTASTSLRSAGSTSMSRQDPAAPAGTTTSGAATATARLSMPIATWAQVVDNANKKGDVLAVARMAGEMAGDLAALLAPASMPLGGHPLDGQQHQRRFQVEVALDPTQEGQVHITASATPRQGGHAAAMTAAAVSALTVYDMCKASSKSVVIEEVALRH